MMTTQHDAKASNTNARWGSLAGVLAVLLLTGPTVALAAAAGSPGVADGHAEDPCAEDGRIAYQVDLSTGTEDGDPIALGDRDPDWISTERPTSSGDEPVYAAYEDGAWYDPAANGDDARWVTPNESERGDYVYELGFHVDGDTAREVHVDIEVVSDDGSDFYLVDDNGNQHHLGQNQNGHSGPPTSLTATVPAADGYTLRAEVNNVIVVTGVFVNGTATVFCEDAHDPCSEDDRERYTVDLSTGTTNGVPDPYGAVDGQWSVPQTPDGEGPEAYSVEPHPWNVWRNSPRANWINPYGDTNNTDRPLFGNNNPGPIGDYVYETSVYVNPQTADTVDMSFRVWVDDKATVDIEDDDGQTVGPDNGPTPGPQAFMMNGIGHHYLDQETGTLSPAYTISADVYNAMTYTGLLVEGEATVLCK